MYTYRVALIGTGAFAATHVEALKDAGERVMIAAAVNPDEEKGRAFCSAHGIPSFFTGAEAMLHAIRPDIVHICTPPATHAALAAQCLHAGSHVLCEKPLCGSLAEFDLLTTAEAEAGRTLSTVFQWRFGAAAQHLKHLIQTNRLGRPLLTMCETLWYRDTAYYDVPWRGQWATALGGATMGLGIHLMDLLLWLLPDWETVQAASATLDRSIEVDNLSLAIVRFANGSYASIVNSALSPRQETRLRFDFSTATVEVTALYSAANTDWRFTPVGEVQSDIWRLAEDRAGTLTAQVHALLDSLDRGERPLVSGLEARRIIEFITALYKSADTGQTINRGSITPEDPYYHSMRGTR